VAVPHDDLESRVTSLEHEVIRLRETQLELRETQLEQGRELVGLQEEIRAGFATLSTGMVEITTMLTKIAEVEQGS
jgi:hypothetical protein